MGDLGGPSLVINHLSSLTFSIPQSFSGLQKQAAGYLLFFWPNGYPHSAIIIDFKNIQAEVHLSDLAGSQRLWVFSRSARKFMFRVSHLEDVIQHLKVKFPMLHLSHTSRSQSTGDFTHLRHICSLRLETCLVRSGV